MKKGTQTARETWDTGKKAEACTENRNLCMAD